MNLSGRFFVKSNYIRAARDEWILCDIRLLADDSDTFLCIKSMNPTASDKETDEKNEEIFKALGCKAENFASRPFTALCNLSEYKSCSMKTEAVNSRATFAIKLVPSGVFGNKRLLIATEDEIELTSWLAVCKSCLGKRPRSVSTKDSLSSMGTLSKSGSFASLKPNNNQFENEFDEGILDNEVYESYTPDNKIPAIVEEIGDWMKLQLSQLDCYLRLTLDRLEVLDTATFKPVHWFPYLSIRRFGTANGVLRVDAGRRCSTGDGKFFFRCSPPNNQTMEQLVTQIRQLALECKEKRGKENTNLSVSNMELNVNDSRLSTNSVQPIHMNMRETNHESLPRTKSKHLKNFNDTRNGWLNNEIMDTNTNTATTPATTTVAISTTTEFTDVTSSVHDNNNKSYKDKTEGTGHNSNHDKDNIQGNMNTNHQVRSDAVQSVKRHLINQANDNVLNITSTNIDSAAQKVNSLIKINNKTENNESNHNTHVKNHNETLCCSSNASSTDSNEVYKAVPYKQQPIDDTLSNLYDNLPRLPRRASRFQSQKDEFPLPTRNSRSSGQSSKPIHEVSLDEVLQANVKQISNVSPALPPFINSCYRANLNSMNNANSNNTASTIKSTVTTVRPIVTTTVHITSSPSLSASLSMTSSSSSSSPSSASSPQSSPNTVSSPNNQTTNNIKIITNSNFSSSICKQVQNQETAANVPIKQNNTSSHSVGSPLSSYHMSPNNGATTTKLSNFTDYITPKPFTRLNMNSQRITVSSTSSDQNAMISPEQFNQSRSNGHNKANSVDRLSTTNQKCDSMNTEPMKANNIYHSVNLIKRNNQLQQSEPIDKFAHQSLNGEQHRTNRWKNEYKCTRPTTEATTNLSNIQQSNSTTKILMDQGPIVHTREESRKYLNELDNVIRELCEANEAAVRATKQAAERRKHNNWLNENQGKQNKSIDLAQIDQHSLRSQQIMTILPSQQDRNS